MEMKIQKFRIWGMEVSEFFDDFERKVLRVRGVADFLKCKFRDF